MSEITLAEATEADTAGIQAVALESWREAYKDIFTPEFINDFVTRAYEPETLLHSITHPADIFLVAREDANGARVVGFCHFGGDGMQLYRLYLLPDHWRQGIGSQMLAELELRLGQRNIPSYYCYVHSHNERAQAFYQQHGFVHLPERDQPDDQEWYMEKLLLPAADPRDRR